MQDAASYSDPLCRRQAHPLHRTTHQQHGRMTVSYNLRKDVIQALTPRQCLMLGLQRVYTSTGTLKCFVRQIQHRSVHLNMDTTTRRDRPPLRIIHHTRIIQYPRPRGAILHGPRLTPGTRAVVLCRTTLTATPKDLHSLLLSIWHPRPSSLPLAPAVLPRRQHLLSLLHSCKCGATGTVQ